MTGAAKCLALLLALATPCGALLAKSGQGQRLSVNPIRRVVKLLQQMQKKVEAEAAKEQVLFDKFLCYCKTGQGSLETSVGSADGANEQLIASIEETDSALTQVKADLKTAQTSRREAKTALAKAHGLRHKGAMAFAKASADMQTNIAATKKATQSLEKGMFGAFLQTSGMAVLKQLSISMENISNADREMLTNFLAEGQEGGSEENAPQTMEITGILKTMTESMEKDLAAVVSEEKQAINDFNGLEAAKTKELNILRKQIETKVARIGELGVQLITQKEDLDDTSKSLMEDRVVLKDLNKSCKTKTHEWDSIKKLRADELVALSETIKVLNDDDALDIFKKTLPSPSLLQLTTTSQSIKKQALHIIERSRHKRHGDFRLNLIALALKGKKVSFDKLISQIDFMVALLKKEQQDDNDKHEYCKLLIDMTEDDLKVLESSASDIKKAIASGKESVAALEDEIKALTEGVHLMDKQVREATEQRKEEHTSSVEVLTSDNAAKSLLELAKNRLHKFYNPILHKAAPKSDLSEGERISQALETEGISLAQLSSRRRSEDEAAPPPPPETAEAYKKKDQDSKGVISMMDIMIADLDKEIQATTVEERDSQKEYEEFMRDSAAKRANDARSISDKEAAKTDLDAHLIRHGEDKTATQQEGMNKHRYLMQVHDDCDWLILNYETRKEARVGEVDSLSQAKAVLSGADYSLLQSSSVHHRRLL